MKIQEINGDLTNSTATFIAHCVNCQGKMNSGVAKAIRTKWPSVFVKYREFWDKFIHPRFQVGGIHWNTAKFLGTVLPAKINDKQVVLNMFCQDMYGYDGKKYADYDAIRTAFGKLKQHIVSELSVEEQTTTSVAIPYKFGCGLAGGDWNIVYGIITETLDELPITLEIWKLE